MNNIDVIQKNSLTYILHMELILVSTQKSWAINFHTVFMKVFGSKVHSKSLLLKIFSDSKMIF